jgi:uncharacterized protein
MYLIDTNIWLEELLGQERALICSRLNVDNVFKIFTEDVLLRSGVELVHLSPFEILEVSDLCERYDLDFDDAYQYAVAALYDADIVSFDRDFDKTPQGRKDPVNV